VGKALKKTPLAVAALCGLVSVSLVHAQSAAAPPPPPKVLQIFREIVKPGHAAGHAKTEAGWPAAFDKAAWPTHYFALTSVSGPSEAWYITPWDSFAAYEKDGAAVEADAALQAELDRLSAADGEHLSNTSSIFAVYREGLSYGAPVNIAEMRYLQVVTFRVKQGRGREFAAARKLVQAEHEKQKMVEHWAMYQVVSGMPAGTYLMFLPLKSMADLDAAATMHGAAYEAAMGEETQQKISDLMNESVDSSSSVVLRFSPKMSYPPKAWAAADPFWAPTAPKAPGKVPAVKKTN
jgi:hypothetical protein